MKPQKRNWRWLKWLGLVVLGLLIVGAIGFYAWASNTPPLDPVALAALQTNAQVQVESGDWLVFRPTAGDSPSAGFIFYPGGRVPPEAYAPQAQAIAAGGYLVAIVPMPLNLAVFNANAARQVQAAFPEIGCWAVGGHSLGGSMAARYANQNREQVAGLTLWASYPAQSDDLSDASLPTVSIYGTLDGLADPPTVRASAALLPPDTVWVPIEGGNHAQFGWYGPQAGDNPAAISPEEQMAQTVAATLAGLEQTAACMPVAAQP